LHKSNIERQHRPILYQAPADWICDRDRCLSNRTALAMVFKLLEAAQKSWRRLDGHNQLPKLVLGVTFNDGIEVIAKPTDRQPITAAA
jgi:hypothetical protein